MRSRHTPVIVFTLLCLTIVGLTAYHLPTLPDQVATHFDAGGKANGWSNQAGFIRFVAIVIAIAAALFFGATLLVRLPESMINLPNKDHWLAPERRDDTFAFIRDWFRWFAALRLAVGALFVGMALRANLAAPPHLSGLAPWILAAYMLIVIAMVAGALWRFRAVAD
jgi:uncharacterized membrane protein